MNDLRPVALTADVMKTCERIALPQLRKVFRDSIDPLQFAYRNDRSCEDAILTILDSVTRHLDRKASAEWYEQTGGNRPSTANSVRIIFYDFRSASITHSPICWEENLLQWTRRPRWSAGCWTTWLPVYSSCGLVSSFLTEYPQTLAALRAQYSPHFCSAYTRWIIGHQLRQTRPLSLQTTPQWLVSSILTMTPPTARESWDLLSTVSRTSFNLMWVKQRRWSLTSVIVPRPPIFINGGEVERVTEYKYRGVVLDNKLEWSSNFDNILKELNSKFHCFRKLNFASRVISYNHILTRS